MALQPSNKTAASATGLLLDLKTASASAEAANPGGEHSAKPAAHDPIITDDDIVKQLEEQLKKWSLELEKQDKDFDEQTVQMDAWDKQLIAKNQKIILLKDSVQKLHNDQELFEQKLELIANQHKELEEILAPLEEAFSKLPRIDEERSETNPNVENLNTQLSVNLKEINDNQNESNNGKENTDPEPQKRDI